MREANQAFYKSGGFAEVKTMKDNMTSEETQKWERKCRETKGREIMKEEKKWWEWQKSPVEWMDE